MIEPTDVGVHAPGFFKEEALFWPNRRAPTQDVRQSRYLGSWRVNAFLRLVKLLRVAKGKR